MTFDNEDPRLTAYLLDELEGEEQAAVEAMLAEDEEAKAFADSMAETVEALRSELPSEDTGDEIGEMRRARIAKRAKSGGSRRWLAIGTGTAAAAAALFFVISPSADRESNKALSVQGEIVATSMPEQLDESERGANRSGDGTTASNTESTVSGTSVAATISKPTDDPAPLDDNIYKSQTDSAGSAGPPTTGHSREALNGLRSTGQYAMRASAGDSGNVVGGLMGETLGNEYARSFDSTTIARGRMGIIGGEGYPDSHYYRYQVPAVDNAFVSVGEDPLSTFSIDVDTASYSQMRRAIRNRSMPAPASVRIEEMINYFDYQYPKPEAGQPFGVVTEVSQAPWNTEHKLVRIGIKAREIVDKQRARANLVFLLDVSGSMSDKDKLPLLKKSFKLLLETLAPEDRIAIVVYAGASGLTLPSTTVAKQKKIVRALKRLKSGGSTNGGAGIELAYKVAQDNFIEGGVNRVILATDGDFNVGTTSRPALIELIKNKAKSDIFLTVLGVGMTDYSDSTMEQLADKGNGNYAFIDTLAEAKKVLVEQVHATLVTVAKDVKLQVEFNPKHVSQFRLIGYENRVLAHSDFNDDSKDAGEIGAGHTVTALYELIPPGAAKVDALKYQSSTNTNSAANSDELMTLKLRYKQPTGTASMKKEVPIYDAETDFGSASIDFKFASAVAAFGMILRRSPHRGEIRMAQLLDWAGESRGEDKHGYRKEFIELIKLAVPLYPR